MRGRSWEGDGRGREEKGVGGEGRRWEEEEMGRGWRERVKKGRRRGGRGGLRGWEGEGRGWEGGMERRGRGK